MCHDPRTRPHATWTERHTERLSPDRQRVMRRQVVRPMTKYIIRRAIQAIPVLIGITIVVYVILQLAPGGPQAKFAQNPRMTHAQKARVHEGLGPRPADPDPVLPLDGLLRPGRRGLRLHRPDGLAELPAGGHQRLHERHPPRRPRLLDHLRREGQRPDHPGRPADVHPGRRRPGHLDRRSRS